MIDLQKILQETDEFAKKRGALIGNTKSIADFMVAAKNFDSVSIIRELASRVKEAESLLATITRYFHEMNKESFKAGTEFYIPSIVERIEKHLDSIRVNP